MDIIIDFDGTCTSHAFPEIGKDIGAVPVLKDLVAHGHRLILFTMRSDNREQKNISTEHPEIHPVGGDYLTEAIKWFEHHEIPLYGVQTNPTQSQWTTSPKAYGHMHIDDAALGCPLMYDMNLSDRPFVDWQAVRELLRERRLINTLF